jgi:hypothetical protein
MDEIKDYAMPTMKAEKALRELHNAFLAQEFEVAKQRAVEAAHWSLKAWEALNEPKGIARP